MMSYVPAKLRRQVRSDAGRRCGYCLSSEALFGTPLEVEHIIPTAVGRQTVRANLWLACHRRNKLKGDRVQATDPLTGEVVPLFSPRNQRWRDHFKWSPDGALAIGTTACGRATVAALQLNNEYIVETRRFWVAAGWHPPVSE